MYSDVCHINILRVSVYLSNVLWLDSGCRPVYSGECIVWLNTSFVNQVAVKKTFNEKIYPGAKVKSLLMIFEN